jgi:hypothetical protein
MLGACGGSVVARQILLLNAPPRSWNAMPLDVSQPKAGLNFGEWLFGSESEVLRSNSI